MTHHINRRAVLAALSTLPAWPALAQSPFPNKPIRLLVGYSAGGGVDAMARLLAPRLSTLLGQQVIVDNRTGAAGLIAADAVSKAPADGYTLMLADSSLLIAKLLNPKLALDPLTAFTPVAGAFDLPLVIVVNNSFPATTPKELVATLKASPGKHSFATSGVGTVQHLAFEMLKAQIGAFVVHIPYRGAAQIVPDVISGQVPIGIVSATSALAQAKAGRPRAVAVMSPVRLAGAENVQPLSDVVPGFSAAPRLFALAPAGTPSEVVTRLSDAMKTVLEAADLAQTAAAQGAVRSYGSAAQLARDLPQESATWARVIRAQKISAEGG